MQGVLGCIHELIRQTMREERCGLNIRGRAAGESREDSGNYGSKRNTLITRQSAGSEGEDISTKKLMRTRVSQVKEEQQKQNYSM